MKIYKEIETNYDVSGGDKDFEGFIFEGNNFVGVQIYYTSLNKADHKIRLRESMDGVNYLDALDSAGNNIEITLDNTLSSDILKAYNFNSKYIAFSFVEGTTGTGTIDSLKIVME